jgi:hypothetical protein
MVDVPPVPRLVMVRNPSAWQYFKTSLIFEVLLALFGSPVVAGLVLGAHEAVGTAATIGPEIQVALLCRTDAST